MKYEIRFRNRMQAVLYVCELKGQISDGHWENSSPSNHWTSMCDAIVSVAGDNIPGISFIPRRKYNFNSNELFSVVGDRMLWWARIGAAFPEMSLDKLEEVHWDLDYMRLENQHELFEAKISDDNRRYLAERRLLLKDLFKVETNDELCEISQKILDQPVTLADVRRELRDMSAIVNSARALVGRF